MFYFLRTFKMAVHALRRNVMRSALTTLGIVIGVAAVIAMVEIGEGSRVAVALTIQAMGANNLIIQSGAAASGGVTFGSGTSPTLTPGDAEALERDCQPLLVSVAPVVRVRTDVVHGNRNWRPPYIYGTSADYLDVRQWDLAGGRGFTAQEVSAADVCVLGQTVARELFAEQSPVDEVVRVNNVPLKVIGVLHFKGANMLGQDQDDILLAPWRTMKFKVSGTSATMVDQSTPRPDPTLPVIPTSQRYPNLQPNLYPTPSASQQLNDPPRLLPTFVDQIHLRVASEGAIKQAVREITAVLRERHRLRPGQQNDFNIRDMTEVSRAMGSTSELMGALLLCVALISLVVGGVGIMNIMLVSVTERTREIGLRMAVGARGRDILRQFLVESVLLCLLGGAIGIVLGRGGSMLVNWLLRWPTVPSLPAVVAAVGVSVGVGMVFGYYPAWKASRLDPIEALRYE